MIQRFRIKVMAAAVAMLASASAQALTVAAGSSGTASFSELALVAFDFAKAGQPAGLTYVRGLGVNMNDFLPNSPFTASNPVSAGAAAAFAGGTRTPEAGVVLSYAAQANDSNWSNFTSQVINSGSSLGNIRWGVVGYRNGNPVVATQFPAVVHTGGLGQVNNATIGTFSGAINLLFNTANSPAVPGSCGNSVFDSCITEQSFGENFGANVPGFDGAGTLSEVLPFNLSFKNAAGSAGASAVAGFCNSFDCAEWSINGATGEVTYTLGGAPVAPPPDTQVIPLPAAGWLLLTGLAGLAGLSRRKRNAA